MTLQDRHEIHFNQKEEITPEISAYRAEHLIKTGNQAHIILGDQKYKISYSKKSNNKNLMLHSYQIKFMIKNKKFTYRALLPEHFKKLLKTKRLTFLNY